MKNILILLILISSTGCATMKGLQVAIDERAKEVKANKKAPVYDQTCEIQTNGATYDVPCK